MKRFIYILLRFVFLLVLAVVLIPFFDLMILRYSIDQRSNVLVLGDSHSEVAINDMKIPSILNISQSSETYFFTYYKLRKILGVKNVDAVIISCSPHNFSEFQDNKTLGLNGETVHELFYERYALCLDVQAINYLWTHTGDDFVRSGRRIVGENLKNCLQLENGYIGKFRLLRDSHLEPITVRQEAENHFWKNTSTYYGFSEAQEMYLYMILWLCQEKGVTVALVNLPVSRFYKENIPNAFMDHYVKTVRAFCQKGVKYFDYSSVDYPDKYFYDGNHLNSVGAELFTEAFVSDLHKHELISNHHNSQLTEEAGKAVPASWSTSEW